MRFMILAVSEIFLLMVQKTIQRTVSEKKESKRKLRDMTEMCIH